MPKPIVLSRTAARMEGALLACLLPKLAKDKKLDLKTVLKGTTAKSVLAKDGKTVDDAKLKAIWKGAWDAAEPGMTPEAKTQGHTPDDVIMHLLKGAVSAGEGEQAPDEVPATSTAASGAAAPAGGAKEKVLDWAKTKGLDEGAMNELAALFGEGGEDEDKTDKDMKDGADDEEEPGMKPKEVQGAIDKALEVQRKKIVADQRAIRDAERAVRPYIGELTQAFDTADEIYKLALTEKGVDTAGVHPSAYPALLKMVPLPGSKSQTQAADAVIASDAATVSEFHKRFPGSDKIGVA